VAAFALVLAACGGGEKSTGGQGGAKSGGTMIFAASSDPKSLDPAFVSDGESIRITNQLYEGLVATKPGGLEIVPSLAESWTPSADGKSWTFKLHTGVKFHDGTDFNAAAVCYNFDRQYNFKGLAQSDAVSYYWVSVFGGFSDHKTPSLYAGCEAPDPQTAVLKLTRRSSSFLAALSLSSFSIQSPTALKQYKADEIGGTEDSPRFSAYGLEHPTGTGPFKFSSFKAGDRTEIVRNDDYWGKKATLDKVIFRTIADGAARRQALESKELQGYDNVDPNDVDALKANFQVLQRPAFNVAYVGMNQSKPPMDNIKIREAVAYALNKDALLKAKYPPGSQAATNFMPPEVPGYNPDVNKYSYDPNKAKQLIAESGVKNPTIEFWYPTGVSRPYMPDPASNFQAFKADLEKVGFKIVPKSAPWSPDYLDAYQSGKAQMYLIGWTGDYGDAGDFLGIFFGSEKPEWGFKNPKIFGLLQAADSATDQAKREALYKQAAVEIANFVPGVPYAHTGPFLAFAKNVQGYIPSPVTTELFSTVTLGT